MLTLGFTLSQVVHDYGDICQAVTELALEQNAPITTDEFHTLNRCLDTATAEADEVERAGHVAHETRDLLNTALVAFEALKRGSVAINGSTAAVLGRSLISLRDLTNSTLSDIRMEAQQQRRQRIQVASLLHDLAVASGLHAEYRGLQFAIESVDPALAVTADPQILASAVTNLLNNAFKFTRTGGRVVLKAHGKDGYALIEVEDECGGIPESTGDPFQSFGAQRGRDRTGLGLGLAIARKAVRAHGGDIYIRNTPGKGCVFSIEVPLAPSDSIAASAVV